MGFEAILRFNNKRGPRKKGEYWSRKNAQMQGKYKEINLQKIMCPSNLGGIMGKPMFSHWYIVKRWAEGDTMNEYDFIRLVKRPKRNYAELLADSVDFGSWDGSTYALTAEEDKKKKRKKKQKLKKLVKEIEAYEFL